MYMYMYMYMYMCIFLKFLMSHLFTNWAHVSTSTIRFEIISKKESGVIYGWQLELNGAIQYGKTLPPDTQISRYCCALSIRAHLTCCTVLLHTCTSALKCIIGQKKVCIY